MSQYNNQSGTPGVSAESQKGIVVPIPDQNQHLDIVATEGGKIDLGFDIAEATIARDGADLTLEFANGGSVTITDFFVFIGESDQEFVMPDGTTVATADMLTALNIDVTPAAGPQASANSSSGGGEYRDGAGDLLGGIDRLGMTDPFFWSGNTDNSIRQVIGTIEMPAGSFDFGISSLGLSSSGIYEDWKPTQNTDGSSADEVPAKIDFQFQGQGSTIATGVHLSGFPVGTELRVGNPDGSERVITIESEGQIVTFNPDEFQNPGVYVYPPKDSDVDMDISVQVDLLATSSGQTGSVNGSFTIIVDAVADKPEDVSVEDGTASLNAGEVLHTNGEVEFKDGWASQNTSNILGNQKVVTTEVSGVFGDFTDGSEEHFVIVKQPDGLTLDENSITDLEYEKMSPEDIKAHNATPNAPQLDENGTYYKITADGNLDADGKFTHDIDFIVPKGTANGDYKVDVIYGSHEKTESDQELNTDNNWAYTENESGSINVNGFNSSLTIKSGWGYESNNGNKDGGDRTSTPSNEAGGAPNHLGAPIIIEFDDQGDEELGITTITVSNPDAGTFYLNIPNDTAVAIDYDSSGGSSSGTVKLTAEQLKSGNIFFKPNPNYTSDADINLSYSTTITEKNGNGNGNGNGTSYKINGEIPIVIDAVADQVKISKDNFDYAGIQTAASSGEEATLTIDISKNDNTDGSEFVYVLIPKGDPIASVTGALDGDDLANFGKATGADLDNFYVVRVDSNGKVESTVKVDVTLQETDSDINTNIDYKIAVVEGHGAGNSKELWEEINGTTDKEYDFTNNVAWSDGKVNVEINVLDGQWSIGTSNVSEDYSPNKNVGDMAKDEKDAGLISISLNGDDSKAERLTSVTITADKGFDSTHGTVQYKGADRNWHDATLTTNDDGTYSFTIKGTGSGNGIPEIRYQPSGYDDHDFNFTVKGETVDTSTDKTGSFEGAGSVEVDAVADKPTDIIGNPENGSGTLTGFDTNVTVSLGATYKDYLDGSESHYMLVEVPKDLTLNEDSLKNAGLSEYTPSDPENIDFTEMEGSGYIKLTGEQLLDYYEANGIALPSGTVINEGSDYYVLAVDKNINQSDGTVKIEVEFKVPAQDDPSSNDHKDEGTGNYTYEGSVIGWAQESPSDNELNTSNNDAFTQGDMNIIVTGKGEITVETKDTYEGLDPNKNLDPNDTTSERIDLPKDAGEITFKYDTEFEVVESITITFDSTPEGKIQQWDPKTGVWNDVPLESDDITVKLGSYDAEHPIRYVPNQYSDKDPSFTWKVETSDTRNNEIYEYNSPVDPNGDPISTVIVVDAVADKPTLTVEGSKGILSTESDLFTLKIEANFPDKDGSEEHTIVVNVPAGWLPNGINADGTGTYAGEGEYDANNNTITIEVNNPNSDWNGSLDFTIPKDDTSVITVDAKAHENATGSTEITETNNDAITSGSVSVSDIETPTFSVSDGTAFENSQDLYNEYNQKHGTINENVDKGPTFLNNPELAPGVKISEVIVVVKAGASEINSGDFLGANFVYIDADGNSSPVPTVYDPVTGQYTLDVSGISNFDASQLHFQPQGHYNGSVELDVSVKLSNGAGLTTTVDVGTANVSVDAVATTSGEVSGEADLSADDVVKISISTSFADNDGSEKHYVLLECKDGWESLNFRAGKQTILDSSDNKQQAHFYQIDVTMPNGLSLGDGWTNKEGTTFKLTGQDEKGNYTVEATTKGGTSYTFSGNTNTGEVTVSLDVKQPSANSDTSLKTGSLVVEHPEGIDGVKNNTASTEANDETHANNNVSFRPGETVDWGKDTYTHPGVTVDPDWAYENDQRPDSEAPCNLNVNLQGFADGKVDNITIEFDFKGSADVPTGTVTWTDKAGETHDFEVTSDGKVSIENYDGGKLIYTPSGSSDLDISINVSVTGTDSKGNKDVSAGTSGTVHVDAVADETKFVSDGDKPVITDPTGKVGDEAKLRPGGSFKIDNLEVKFTDLDGSEKHSLLFEAKPGWTYEITVGNPVQTLTGGELVQGSDGKTYWKFDVDGVKGAIDSNGICNADVNVKLDSNETVLGGVDGKFNSDFNFGGRTEEINTSAYDNQELTTSNNQTDSTWQWGTSGGDKPGGNGGIGELNPLPPVGGGTGSGNSSGSEWVHENPGSDDKPLTGDHADVKIPTDSVVSSWGDGTITVTNGTTTTIYTKDGTNITVSVDGGPSTSHNGGITIEAGSTGSYTPPPYSDKDTSITYKENGKDTSHTVNVIVDATAQAPELGGATADYNENDKNTNTTTNEKWTAEDLSSKNTYIKVGITFPDTDGSEQHYILIEAQGGWSCTGAEGTVMQDGTLYFKVPVANATPNPDGTYTIELHQPNVAEQGSSNWDESTGSWHYDLKYGGMAVENVSDKEMDYSNNIAINISDNKVGIDFAPADSHFTIKADGYGYEGNIKGYDADGNVSHDDGVKLSFEGALGTNDQLTQDVVITLNPSGEGKLYDTSGNELVKNPAVEGEYIISKEDFNDGSNPTIIYKPNSDSYNHGDVEISWNTEAKDTTSGDSQKLGGTTTVVIDNVAHRPEVEASVENNSGMEAVIPGGSVTIKTVVTFDNGDDGAVNSEGRYILIKNTAGVTIDLTLFNKGYEIVPVDGDFSNGYYYAIPVTTDGVTAIDINGGKSTEYEYNFNVTTDPKNLTGDGSVDIKIGAMVDEAVGSVAGDKEMEVGNNQVISSGSVTIEYASVTTGDIKVDFNNGSITEDNALGTEFVLSVTTTDSSGVSTTTNAKDAAETNNEILTDTTLTFETNGTGGIGGNVGEIVGSVIYDGKVYYIEAKSGNSGEVKIDFGSDGYNGGKLTVVWGKVERDDNGKAISDPDGNYKVYEWNHAASGDLTVNANTSLKDLGSGATANSETKTDVNIVDAADAPTDLVGNASDSEVGAGESLSVTVNGKFADTDGSEDHYLLVEAKPGWSASVGGVAVTEKITIDGVEYYKISVESSLTDPRIEVEFKVPAGESVGSNNLQYGGLSQETGSRESAHTISDDTIDYTVSGVTATGVTVTGGTCQEGQETTITIEMAEAGSGDEISSITITIPKGSAFEDAKGIWHTSDGREITLTGDQIASDGEYGYKAGQYESGNMDISVDVTIQNGSASKDFNKDTTVEVTPVTGQPSDAEGGDLSFTVIPEHKADIKVELSGNFGGDNDGSENHFFAVKLPEGVICGYEEITDENILKKLPGDGPWYRIDAKDTAADKSTADGKFTLTGDYKAGDDITVVAVAQEKNAPTDVNVSEASNIEIGDVPTLNINPEAKDEVATMDTLRDQFQEENGVKNTEGKGKLDFTDKDGDTVTVTGVADKDGTSGTVNQDGSFTIKGEFGTMRINTDGSYTYTLRNPNYQGNDSESFTYTVSDGHGGTVSADITINLTNENQAPVINGDLTTTVGGGNDAFVNGQINTTDADGDSISLTGAGKDGNTIHPDGNGNITLEGQYGTLTIKSDGSYKYELNADSEHLTDVKDVFKVTASDGFPNGSKDAEISIDVKPVNHAPEAVDTDINAATTMTQGSLSLKDWDTDLGYEVNKDTLVVSQVTINGITHEVKTNGENTEIKGEYGVLYINPDGTYYYNRNGGNDGDVDKFEITVKDSGGLTSSADLNITIKNDATSSTPSGRSLSTSSNDAVLAAALIEHQNNEIEQPKVEQQQAKTLFVEQEEHTAQTSLKPMSEEGDSKSLSNHEEVAHSQDLNANTAAADNHITANVANDNVDSIIHANDNEDSTLTVKPIEDVHSNENASNEHVSNEHASNEHASINDTPYSAGGILDETSYSDIFEEHSNEGLAGTEGELHINDHYSNSSVTANDSESIVWSDNANSDSVSVSEALNTFYTDNGNDTGTLDISNVPGLAGDSVEGLDNGTIQTTIEIADSGTQSIVADSYNAAASTTDQESLNQYLAELSIKVGSGGV